MNVDFHKDFEKQWKKLSPKQQAQATSRLVYFRHHPYDLQLYNHPLTGQWRGCRSISISGDLRAIYRPIGKDGAFFIAIGSHSQLYR